MPATARFPLLPYLFALILGVLALGGYWYGLGQPVVLPDVASASHKLQCASYTPFDKDQSPFDQPFTLRPERMDADLALLATRFECIRTYSMTGLEALPDMARKRLLADLVPLLCNVARLCWNRRLAARIWAPVYSPPSEVTAIL